MKVRDLGKTGIKISEVGFGCWAIGGTSYGPTKDEESLSALETAWEAGVNFYDTADTYGHGHSEKLLGQFLRNKPREEITIATKAGWDFYHGGNKKNFDPDYLRFACDESLKRLGVDAIDLYQLHNPSLDILLKGEVFNALDELKRKGKVRFTGVSAHTVEEALLVLETRVDTLQIVFNLLDQRMAEKVFPEAEKRQFGVIAREPLACGVLTDKYKPDHQFPKTDHRRRWTKENFEIELKKVQTLKTILATQRLSLTRAALEYVLDFQAVSTVIPGAKTKEHVLENILASENPQLRSQESYHLRELYHREDIFKKGLFPS